MAITKAQQRVIDRLTSYPGDISMACWGSARTAAENMCDDGLMKRLPLTDDDKHATRSIGRYTLTAAGKRASNWNNDGP